MPMHASLLQCRKRNSGKLDTRKEMLPHQQLQSQRIRRTINRWLFQSHYVHKVVLNAFWSAKIDPKMRHLELVVVCAFQIEQRSNPLKADVKQHSALGNPLASITFFPIVLEHARWWCVSRKAFIDAALVLCGNTGIHNRVPKSLPFLRTKSLFI